MRKHPAFDKEMMLMEYATGTLDEALSLIAASYITLSPDARRYVHSCETIAGCMINNCCEPVSMTETSLNNVLEKLDHYLGEECAAAIPAENEQSGDQHRALPSPVQRYINCLCAKKDMEWKTIHPGIRICNIPLQNSRLKTRIMQMDPGIKTPAHAHRGQEYMLVLEGGFRDENGVYDRGDLLIVNNGSIHQPVADPVEGCLCLVTTEGPLKPAGWFARTINIIWRF